MEVSFQNRHPLGGGGGRHFPMGRRVDRRGAEHALGRTEATESRGHFPVRLVEVSAPSARAVTWVLSEV
ncbi:uncharacterized protein CIMG_12699 [Coccidioides immitis RS]|uniref:Uncharacterized protein n=1 Tax=Coccidioides immitis (strain RS) TaxID=246410 RepID=J3KL30_COCIM|nr:uncharacterized protein CIMG_12699 [Coccidioides immitis RS]EAS36949.3 hypothetical protein CIMG_12699 [Coccidioides immitis RS]